MPQIDLRQVTLKESTVKVDGGDVTVRQLRADDLIAIQAAYEHLSGEQADNKLALDMYVSLVCKSVVDAKGERYLDTEAGEDTARSLPWEVLVTIATEVMQLNGMLGDAKKN